MANVEAEPRAEIDRMRADNAAYEQRHVELAAQQTATATLPRAVAVLGATLADLLHGVMATAARRSGTPDESLRLRDGDVMR
jgi:hypothetical protein